MIGIHPHQLQPPEPVPDAACEECGFKCAGDEARRIHEGICPDCGEVLVADDNVLAPVGA